jgi:hypothetical protein
MRNKNCHYLPNLSQQGHTCLMHKQMCPCLSLERSNRCVLFTIDREIGFDHRRPDW